MAQAWTRHVDGTGFAVDRPAGWRVLNGPDGAFSVADANGSAAALVRQHRLPPGRDLADWLRREFAASEAGLYSVRGLVTRRHGIERASASFDYGSDVLPGRAEVLAVRFGGITTLYIAAAARGDFAERLPLLRRVLDSVRWGNDVVAPCHPPGQGVVLRE
jgi:hypothetical protein